MTFNWPWPLFAKAKPHSVVKYVAATRHDNAKARALQIGKRLELEIMALHAGPERAARAKALASTVPLTSASCGSLCVGASCMTDEDIGKKAEAIAKAVWNPGNKWSLNERVADLLRLVQAIDVADFVDMRASLAGDVSVKEYDAIVPLDDRLFRLHHRLEADGQYVDADIVLQALDRIKKATAA